MCAGMEKFNTLEGNLGVGAIPLLSGMLESDQEQAQCQHACQVCCSCLQSICIMWFVCYRLGIIHSDMVLVHVYAMCVLRLYSRMYVYNQKADFGRISVSTDSDLSF